MCGIIGALGKFEKQSALKGLNRISHRGPDSKEYYLSNKVFFGHTRLAIQDLSINGNQPMWTKDNRHVLIFNGEIYNHIELRKEYLSNINFLSGSDTETVLYGLVHHGIEFIQKLNGIFAFALYDNLEDEILIARDRFGVKPLYYCEGKESFLFSSEIKSIVPLTNELELSPEGLFNYINFLWSPGEQTPFKQVKKLLPGHFVKLKINHLKERKVEQFTANSENDIEKEVCTLNESKLIDELESLLLKAVERQMLSDVEVGFFLSGGLDSSLIVAMARKLFPDKKMECFTIDVGSNNSINEGFVDDLHFAKKVADILKVNLNVVKADIDIVNSFDSMVWHLDEPQADAAPLNVLEICKLAREKKIKVLIGGAGGDDLFSGYRRHQALKIEKALRYVPKYILKLLRWAIQFIPNRYARIRRIKKILRNIDQPKTERLLSYFSWLDPKIVQGLFSNKYKSDLIHYDSYNYFREVDTKERNFSDLDRMLNWELKTFLVDHNFNYTDKMSMAVGVEARVPFLDNDLVIFAKKIPSKYKMRNGETKYILKKVAERYLPKEIIYRPKTGFGAPVRKWITSDLEKVISENLSQSNIEKQGIFDFNKVSELIELNKQEKVDASYSIWAILAIESWYRQFIIKSF